MGPRAFELAGPAEAEQGNIKEHGGPAGRGDVRGVVSLDVHAPDACVETGAGEENTHHRDLYTRYAQNVLSCHNTESHQPQQQSHERQHFTAHIVFSSQGEWATAQEKRAEPCQKEECYWSFGEG